MKENRKLLPVAKLLILFVIALVSINGCKKDIISNGMSSPLTKEQHIANAKNWYESQQKLLSATIESSKDDKAKLIFNPNWEKATVEHINGITVISTFVNTTLRNFDQGATTFNLVIKFDEEGYEAKTVTIKNKEQKDMHRLTAFELYDIAFTKNELANDNLNAQIKVYSQAFKQEKEEIYGPNGRTAINFKMDKLNTTPQTNVTVCFDYWLNVDYYDYTGALVGSTSTYLGRYCQEIETQQIWWIDNGDGTYGGGSEEENVEVETTGILESESTPTEYTEAGILRKSWNASWQFAKAKMAGYTVTGHSTELLKALYHPSTGWVWDTVTNQSITTAGTRPVGMEFVKSGYATTLYNTSQKASVDVSFSLEYSRNGTMRSTPPTSKIKVLDMK